VYRTLSLPDRLQASRAAGVKAGRGNWTYTGIMRQRRSAQARTRRQQISVSDKNQPARDYRNRKCYEKIDAPHVYSCHYDGLDVRKLREWAFVGTDAKSTGSATF